MGIDPYDFCIRKLFAGVVQLSGADTALGLDFAHSQTNQISFHIKLIPSFPSIWSEGVVSKEAASLDRFLCDPYFTTEQRGFQEQNPPKFFLEMERDFTYFDDRTQHSLWGNEN